MAHDRTRYIAERCEECRKMFDRPPGRRKILCSDCRLKALKRNMISQHEKSGPTYEAMVRRCLIFYRAEAKRLGISV